MTRYEELQRKAHELGFVLRRSEGGYVLVPAQYLQQRLTFDEVEQRLKSESGEAS